VAAPSTISALAAAAGALREKNRPRVRPQPSPVFAPPIPELERAEEVGEEGESALMDGEAMGGVARNARRRPCSAEIGVGACACTSLAALGASPGQELSVGVRVGDVGATASRIADGGGLTLLGESEVLSEVDACWCRCAWGTGSGTASVEAGKTCRTCFQGPAGTMSVKQSTH
jgi:hypothetical protein